MLVRILFVILCLCVTANAQDVSISEFLADNYAVLMDEDGDASDWIELYNAGDEAVDLENWCLTDDSGDLSKWRFPDVRLNTKDFLVVFASGKDRRVAGSELHTNFQVDADGEYLALVKPDGVTVHYAFEPAFPPQFEDKSYGTAQAVDLVPLLDGTTEARIWIPSTGDIHPDWILEGFNDTSWITGTTSVGYDTEEGESPLPGEERNLALTGVATQSSTGYGGVPERAIDDNTNGAYGGSSVTHTEAGDPSPSWQVQLQESSAIDRIVLWNRTDACCPRRLSNFRVSILDDGDEAVFSEDFFSDGIGYPTPGVGFQIVPPAGTEGRTVKIEVLGPNADGELYLSLAEVQVFEGIRGYRHLITTDVFDDMYNKSASAYIRTSFDVEDPDFFNTLALKVRYDDGFVAYLNGHEVARRNAPPDLPAWNAAATAVHDDAQAVQFETINLSMYLDLVKTGENLLALHALNVNSDDEDFLMSYALEAASVSYTALRFFREPTPGEPNITEAILGFVADTRFSADRGFYDAPFSVAITTQTSNAEIRYTIDGSAPTEEGGVLYTVPVLIERTTVLRAAAFKAGLEPTNVDTHTYIFLDDVITSNVMDTAITEDPLYAPQMRAALTDLPTVSIVTGESINDNVEVPMSLEWIPPDGCPGFQENCGVRYFGGAFTSFAKKNFRMYFRGEYGARKLRYPLFAGHDHGIRAVEVFDQLELRSGSHDMVMRGFYLSNRFTDDTMLDMGNINPHGRFVHAYINGTYWGQYHLRERWNADMLAQYLGGEKEEYEAINGNWNVGGWADPGVPYDGDGSAWTRIKSLRSDYEAVSPYLDVQHYIDYMIMFMFGNAETEYRCAGPTAEGSGFKFYLNDADGFTRNAGDRTVMDQPGRRDGDGPGSIFSMLLAEGYPDYLTLLGDRIHKHYFNDGAMTRQKMTARLLERCVQVERAFIAESARWGYRTPASWKSARDSYVSGVLQSRTETVINQFRAAGFYPAVEAPVFNHNGGAVEPGFTLMISAQSGTVYYTTDGTDPRLPGGGIAPDAMEAGSVSSEVVISEGAGVRMLVPVDDSLGLDWTQPGFDDATWGAGVTGLGYENNSGYENHFATDIHDTMYDKNASIYIRIPFMLDPSLFDGGRPAFVMADLSMKYDDGFIVYLNGEFIAAGNAPGWPAWNSVATTSHSDALAVQYESVDFSQGMQLLKPGENLLAVHGLNITTGSSDFLIVPRLEIVPESEGIAVEETSHICARSYRDGQWSALNEAVFAVPSPLEKLKITEIMYHAPDGEAVNGNDYEFIEFQNTGEQPLDLSAVVVSGGISFTFAEGIVIDPGAFLLVVQNFERFREKYPEVEEHAIVGFYTQQLSNEGDCIMVEDTSQTVQGLIATIHYDDICPWPPESDGLGSSLVPVDVQSEADPSSPEYWRASTFAGGSPGESDPGSGPEGGWQIPGDINQDAGLDLSDAVGLLLLLFGNHPPGLSCGDGTLDDPANLALLDANGDESVNLADVISLLSYLFAGGEQPVMGSECIRIPGCPDSCR